MEKTIKLCGISFPTDLVQSAIAENGSGFYLVVQHSNGVTRFEAQTLDIAQSHASAVNLAVADGGGVIIDIEDF